MKKTFLARRNAVISSARFSYGAIVLVFAVVLLSVRIIAPNLFLHLVSPVFNYSDSVAANWHAFFSKFSDAAVLALENDALRESNAARLSNNQELTRKLESIGALNNDRANDVLGGVVARPPVSPYDTIIVGSGENAGVQQEMEVFAAGNVPIGVVSEVLKEFSRVTLFSSPSAMVSGWVGENRTPITIYGAGGGVMRSTVSRAASVAIGDTVFVPGPGMLPIGSVEAVDSNPSSPSVILHIRSDINLFSVDWVRMRATGPTFAASLSWATSTP